MRITWLLEQADQLWGGVKVALEDANWLSARGHQVTVLSRSGPPAWMALRCQFHRVPDFARAHLPEADVLVATFWSTLPCTADAGPGRGAPVHFCQGYEGDNPENAGVRERIEAAYRLPSVHHVTIAPHLTQLLLRRFGIQSREIVYAIDHTVHFPSTPRAPGPVLRVGLVGPWQIAWKDIATGIDACRLAVAAGQPLQLVRVTNTQPDPAEQDLPFPVEWHVRRAPSQMGEIYRSLDVFLGTSSGPEEGFFLPAVEAMACGVPCVLTDVPCFRAHGDGSYALFVPPRDPGAMAEALVLAGRMHDVRRGLRRAGLAAAGRYTQLAHGTALEQALLAYAVQSRGQNRHLLRALPSATALPPAIAADCERLERQLLDALRSGEQQLLQHGDRARAARLHAAAACLHGPAAASSSDAAWALFQAGDAEAALQQLDALAQTGSDDAILHERRGLLLLGHGRAADAVQAFRRAIAAGGRSADLCNNLGVALFRTGDVAGARAHFERALALEPRHEDARANLADLPAA